MIRSYVFSPLLIALGGIVLIALISLATKRILLPLLGIEWPFRRVRVPWRFSLYSVTILVGLSALVLGLLRDSPDAALFWLVLVLTTWLTAVRYIDFRRTQARRRNEKLATLVRVTRNGESDAP